jgi:hypothetical protein
MDEMQGHETWTDEPTPLEDDAPVPGSAWDSADPWVMEETAAPGTAMPLGETAPVAAGVEGLPTEIAVAEPQFGAALGPYGTTQDAWDEDYYWSTTENAYYGEQSGREIDDWTGTEVQ